MSKEIWLSMHPRKFGNHVTVHAPSAPRAYQCEITQSTGIATQMQHEVFWREIAWPPGLLREKKQQQNRV